MALNKFLSSRYFVCSLFFKLFFWLLDYLFFLPTWPCCRSFWQSFSTEETPLRRARTSEHRDWQDKEKRNKNVSNFDPWNILNSPCSASKKWLFMINRKRGTERLDGVASYVLMIHQSSSDCRHLGQSCVLHVMSWYTLFGGGCNIGNKPLSITSGQIVAQTKSSRCTSNKFCLPMVSIIFGSTYYTDILCIQKI